jgi:hypothetical protein
MNDNQIIEATAAKCGHLECDGTVRVLDYVLNEHGIKHTCFAGPVVNERREILIPLHYWIVLEDNRTVDYKCRMWLGDKAPNGIFNQKDYPDFIYSGSVIDMKTSKLIYQILLNEF